MTKQQLKIVTHSEQDTPRGWQWTVEIQRGTRHTTHTVRLSWQDHDHWCGGMAAPWQVVERVVDYCIAHGQTLPEQFDAARARRWFPAIDHALRSAA